MEKPRPFFPSNGQPARRAARPPPIEEQAYDPQYPGGEPDEPQMWTAPAEEEPLYDEELPEEISEEEFDQSLGAIQERIKVANYLQLLLEAPLFGDDQSPVARLVLGRVRMLLRQEAEVVLGIRTGRQSDQVDQIFSADEVQALKTLAARVLAPRDPAVKPVKTQEPPAPVAVKPVAKPAPVIPKVQPVRTPAPPPPPKPAPVVKKPAASPQPVRQPQRPTRKSEAPQQPAGIQERIAGLERNSNGRLQRHMEFEGPVPTELRASAMQAGMSVQDYLTQDVTAQVVPTQRVPMPDKGMLSLISEQQAMATVQAQGNKTGRIAALSGAQ